MNREKTNKNIKGRGKLINGKEWRDDKNEVKRVRKQTVKLYKEKKQRSTKEVDWWMNGEKMLKIIKKKMHIDWWEGSKKR